MCKKKFYSFNWSETSYQFHMHYFRQRIATLWTPMRRRKMSMIDFSGENVNLWVCDHYAINHVWIYAATSSAQIVRQVKNHVTQQSADISCDKSYTETTEDDSTEDSTDNGDPMMGHDFNQGNIVYGIYK